MGDLTKNFSRAEFRCRHCGRLPSPAPHLRHLANHLQKLRDAVGKPLAIVSGYRCPEHNAAVGGAPRSEHLLARAADIPFGYATIAQAAAAGFTGIGDKRGYATHVDLGLRRRWHYS